MCLLDLAGQLKILLKSKNSGFAFNEPESVRVATPGLEIFWVPIMELHMLQEFEVSKILGAWEAGDLSDSFSEGCAIAR